MHIIQKTVDSCSVILICLRRLDTYRACYQANHTAGAVMKRIHSLATHSMTKNVVVLQMLIYLFFLKTKEGQLTNKSVHDKEELHAAPP